MDEVTFKAVFPNASKFKKIWQPILKLFEELPLKITQEGINVKRMSSDNNLMVIFNMVAASFEEYVLMKDELLVKLIPDEVSKVIKRGTRDDMVILSYETGSPYFIIKFINKKTSVEREFKVSALEMAEEEDLQEPEVDLTVEATMKPKDLRDIVADAKIIGEEVLMETPSNDMIRILTSDVGKSYEAQLSLGNPLLSLIVDEKAKAKYSVAHLYDASRAYQAAESLSLSFGQDLPLRIDYEMEMGSSLRLWIAPRL
ncbi:hypothetical protein IPA_09545 [Ignicoccus pacificus DSM 13166]|uniref:DNA polymerase sliding clamp n=1 Tax=Ignicoccus pacificus DSM 13166 TaxID=940294 RepID=A0A977KC65_9CREN|nr:hypothetical protein IPA_09545 [Ignicoccus pacificus DSM 13166]